MTEAAAARPASRKLGAVTAVVASVALTLAAVPAAGAGHEDGSARKGLGVLDPGLSTVGDALQDVVVTGAAGVAGAAEAVRRAGGVVEAQLPIVHGVEARVPASALPGLAGSEGVAAVTKDRQARFENVSYDDTAVASTFVRTTEASAAWAKGALGAGVGSPSWTPASRR